LICQTMAHSMGPTISIIIPVHCAADSFRRCLLSVAGAAPQPDEVIVVVDGPDNAAAQMAEAFGARVTQTTSRGGPARARNVGAQMAGSELLFFVDADVLIPGSAVGQVAAAFEREPNLDALFGSYDDAPDASNFLSQYKNLLHHYVHQTAREQAFTFWAACGAVRREVFLALGGFDERYRRPSVEDIELGYRLTQAGHRIRLCKSLQVKHLKQWTVVPLLQSDFFQRALPWSELILRSRNLVNDLNLQHSSRVSVLAVLVLTLALVGAWWWPALLLVACTLALLLLMLNAPVYRFFKRKRGLVFALRTIPWHWFYYLYSGLAFAISGLLYVSSRLRAATTILPESHANLSEPKGGPGPQ
jgi:GT2 family glycosyltransferase